MALGRHYIRGWQYCFIRGVDCCSDLCSNYIKGGDFFFGGSLTSLHSIDLTSAGGVSMIVNYTYLLLCMAVLAVSLHCCVHQFWCVVPVTVRLDLDTVLCIQFSVTNDLWILHITHYTLHITHDTLFMSYHWFVTANFIIHITAERRLAWIMLH